MRIPQAAERLKEVPAQALRAALSKTALPKDVSAQQALRAVLSREAPAQALRAVFAGVGQVLLVTERVRRRAMGDGQGPAVPAAPAKAAPAKAASAKPVKAASPAASPKKTASPKAPATDPGGAPPIPHYSELSVASLRARMRGLDTGQLRDLIGYERAHEGRETVIAMFERRIAKLDAAGPAAG